MKRGLILALLVTGMTAGLVTYRLNEPGNTDGTTTLETTGTPGMFAASFSGTRPDGRFKLNGDKLVLDAGLFEFFDYYLSAQGEKTLEEIRQQIEAELTATLPADAAKEAKRLLHAYLGYKQSLTQVMQTGGQNGQSVLEQLRHRLSGARLARSRYFTPTEIKQLFGDRDTEEDQALARLEIQQDKTLSAEQKLARLAALDAQLPPEQRKLREQSQEHAALHNDVENLRKQGASEAQIYQLRTQRAGPEAAQRLASLDQEEQHWQQRVDNYLAARGQILNSQQAPAEREAAIQRLRQEKFSPQEQLRLSAFEEMGNSQIH